MDTYTEQFFKVQLKWASANFDAEHRLRLAAEQRAAGTRELLMDLAKSLLASELDAVQKQNEDFNRWSDGELMRWTKDQLRGYLHQLRGLTGEAGRRRLEQAIQEIQKLKAENAQLNQHVRSLESADRRAKAYQEHTDQQKQQIDHLQQELADARADLEIARSEAARPASPGSAVIIEMSEIVEPVRRSQSAEAEPIIRPSATSEPNVRSSSSTPSSATSDWYAAWQDATAPDAFERQQRILEVIGQGAAFFRSEIIEALNAAGLRREDPDRPSGTLHRLFAGLTEHGLIEELDGGYPANIPRPLVLTERGRDAYQRFTGQTLTDSLYQRLLNRHKTVEHTVLNLMARQVLQRFHYTSIDLFPEARRTSAGAVVIPDLTAVSPQGETLLIECERLAKHRTADERRNKWGDLAALTQGHFRVVVAGGQQQTALITEISTWLHETDTKRAQLSVCQYVKAARPNATTPWTYTTSWALA